MNKTPLSPALSQRERGQSPLPLEGEELAYKM